MTSKSISLMLAYTGLCCFAISFFISLFNNNGLLIAINGFSVVVSSLWIISLTKEKSIKNFIKEVNYKITMKQALNSISYRAILINTITLTFIGTLSLVATICAFINDSFAPCLLMLFFTVLSIWGIYIEFKKVLRLKDKLNDNNDS